MKVSQMKAKSISLKQLIPFIKKAKKICIATHQGPDGDGLGSILALGMGLKQLKKEVYLYNVDLVPKMYHFLPGQKQIKNKIPKNKKFDLTFIVDLGEIERVGEEFASHAHRGVTISLDHHAKGVHNADYNYCLPKKSSSGEVIYGILKTLKVKFNNAMATNIYTAIVTDTGSFKYSNTNQETFAVAADLAQYNIDFWNVALHCFETYSLGRMELLKRVIKRMDIHKNKKIASIEIKKSDFKATGASPEDTEGFINYPRSIDTVEVAVAFKQQGPKDYRISLRSKKYVDVAAIALKFEGGGHIRAAGCGIKGDFATVKKKLYQEIIRQL